MPLDWLILGGGIHGVHLANVLVAGRGVPRDRLAVIDPAAAPLAAWDRRVANVGMEHLRSPGVHHLGLCPMDLIEWVEERPGWRAAGALMERYSRPSVAAFRAHCDDVAAAAGLAGAWIAGRAVRLARRRDGWRVATTAGEVAARRVVLAVGQPPPAWPDWAAALRRARGPIIHVLDTAVDRGALPPASHAVVVGAGISAAQVALALAAAGGRVTLVARHPLRRRLFDSDPLWLGPRHMARFLSIGDPARRRRVIAAARHRGSMPPEVAAALRAATRAGRVRLVRDAIVAARPAAGGVLLELSGGGLLGCDRVVLATGFEPGRPGGELVDRAVADLRLPVAPCGYPLLDAALRWAPGLYVTGALAELELGPVARNIAGARRAGERIAPIAGEITSPAARPRGRAGGRGPSPGPPRPAGPRSRGRRSQAATRA